jgi:5-formyltetrahydrofolate cyclo-ligase
VLAFSPLADEPDLRVVWASWQHSGWRIAFPRSTATDAHGFEPVVMSMDDQQWTRGPFGTQEPASRFPAVPIDAIDVILVPARSIDRRGARLGRGGGVYDRVLNRLPQRCQRVGVIFSLQFRESIPSGPQDAQIGLWVDETGWHRPAAPKEIVANTAEA